MQTFKEYMIREYTGVELQEELIMGGINKVLKRLKFWFDGGEKTTRERIKLLRQEMINAGGPQKFAMVIRRIPSVKHWMRKHAEELPGRLGEVVNLI